jgi:hypothetical protein
MNCVLAARLEQQWKVHFMERVVSQGRAISLSWNWDLSWRRPSKPFRKVKVELGVVGWWALIVEFEEGRMNVRVRQLQ